MPLRILIVEDDPAVRELISVNLTHAGFGTVEAEDAEQAWRILCERTPDAAIVDWMLPGMSGFHLVRHMRADTRFRTTPLVMVTARGDEIDKVTALGAGVDDYVTKPFSPKELIARLRAILRCQHPEAGAESVEVAGLRLVPRSWEVTARGTALSLGPTEFKLLHFLMSNAERIYSRSQLIERVWGRTSAIEERTVDVHIRRLRSALSEHRVDTHLQTVYGVGYRFSEQASN
ncbi:MAG: response regulator [Rhodocyclaceae bacterium]|nr:response regulator [Rhodocyclaceae bacterium]